MQAVQRTLELLYERKIKQEYDRIIPVVADEGDGKSTFILSFVWRWQTIRGVDPTPDNVLDRIVWDDRAEFKKSLAHDEPRSAIAVMDAARVLHKKDAMHGDQKEVEKDLLDVRTKEHMILLGFQDWDIIPTFLQKRRAKNLFYIPHRGTVYGYNRNTLDKRVGSDNWPDPDIKDTFPSLEGTDTWEEFQRRDKEKKQGRILGKETQDPKDAARQESVKTVLRAVKPWDDDRGMTYRDAAELVDYSRTWVSDRVDEWEKGKHDGLLDEVVA